MFELKPEELNVLGAIGKLESKNVKAASFYEVAEYLQADTNRLIPVMERLEEDGYVTSTGLIFRYFHMTEKGESVTGHTGGNSGRV